MLKISEVASRLNLSESSVYELVDAGKIIVHRFGKCRGAIRVSEDDLQAYIESCREAQETITPEQKKGKAKVTKKFRHLNL